MTQDRTAAASDERREKLERMMRPSANGEGAGHEPVTDAYLTGEGLDKEDCRVRWYVEWVFVACQPMVCGGPTKSLKTSVLVDMAIALGSAVPFLGKFRVPGKVRVLFVSCESGRAVIQETARRVALARGVRLADTDTLWWFDAYQLASVEDLARLEASIKKYKPEVVILDPLYLMLLSGEDARGVEAANLFDMGPLLMRVARVCLDAGATPVLSHHARKNLPATHEPLTLDDLAYSGCSQFARQWCLINRRQPYEPGSGSHRLWLAIGGSAGHSGLYAVDAEEGQLNLDFTGRKWDVTVSTGTDARQQRQEAKRDEGEQRRRQKRERNARDVLVQLDRLAVDGGGVSRNRLREALGWSGDRLRWAVDAGLEMGFIETCAVMVARGNSASATVEGVRRVNPQAAGKP